MPLSTTDPFKYSDALELAALARAVSLSGEDYTQTFQTEGEAINFSQRFYMWRKALTTHISTLDEPPERLQNMLHYANQVVIRHKRGTHSITMAYASSRPENLAARAFLARHYSHLTPEEQYALGIDNQISQDSEDKKDLTP